jgi:circadian clock protein KaiC
MDCDQPVRLVLGVVYVSKHGAVDKKTPTDHVPLPKAPTGIRGLDDVLLGGVPAGRTTLLTGGPGTGKTVVGVEFAYRGALAGEPAVVVSFEERADALRQNAATMGFDLAALEAAGALRVIDLELPTAAVRSGDFDISGLLAILGTQVEEIEARRILVDAIDQVVGRFVDAERERDQLTELQRWLRDRRLTALLTLKAAPGGELTYPHLAFLTDCVLHLDQRMEDQVRTRRLRVLKYRGSGFLSNEYPYVVTPNGVVVMPVSMIELEQPPPEARISSGDAVLDELLAGGFRAGTAVLIAGPTGAGKTTLASLFARAACSRAEPVLYVSFEEAEVSLMRTVRSAGIDLGSAVEDGCLRIHAAMPEGRGVEEHLLAIVSALEEHHARHLVVDAISACRRIGSSRAAFDFLVRLMAEARRRHVTCIFTNQTPQLDEAHRIANVGISSLIDTVLVIRYVTRDGAFQRRLQVLKSRGSAHSNHFHRLDITDGGIVLSPLPDPAGDHAAGSFRTGGEAE